MPIFLGGMVRWFVDWQRRRHADSAHLTEEEHTAEGDKSPGVLMASGYIAGGAIAGILIAFMAGVPFFEGFNARLDDWASHKNPFYAGPSEDLLSCLPFVLLIVLLYLVGREVLLKPKEARR
jgi:hypothetical protein